MEKKTRTDKTKESEEEESEKTRRQQIIDLLQQVFTTLTQLWLVRKKLTVLTLLWVMSILGFNTGTNFTKDQMKSSREEISRLHQKLEKLPELEAEKETQKKELDDVKLQLQQKITLEEKDRTIVTDLTQQLAQSKQQFLDQQLDQQEEQKKLDHLLATKKITIQKLQEKGLDRQKKYKDLEKRYKKDLKTNQDRQEKLKQAMDEQLYQQKSENTIENNILKNSLDQKIIEFQNLEQELEIARAELEEKTGLINLQELQLENFSNLSNKDFQKIEELQQKLEKKNTEVLELARTYKQDMLEIENKVKGLEQKIQDVEIQGQLRSILFSIGQFITSKTFNR